MAQAAAAASPSSPWCAPTVIRGHNFAGPLPAGLRYARDFITPDEEAELDEVMGVGDQWMRHLKSRAQQFFGLVYYQTTHALPALQPAGASEQAGRPLGALPPWLLPRVLATQVFASAREVSQVAANEYLDNAGISPHVEDPTAFGPNLATLSLLSPVHLTLIPTSEPPLDQCGVDHGNWVKVLLEPRSLFVLQGESRYDYRHGIRRSRSVPLPGGTVLRRGSGYRRVSLTFRELLATRRQLEEDCVHGPTDQRPALVAGPVQRTAAGRVPLAS